MCDLQMVDFATQAHTYTNTWAEITPLEALLPRFLGLTEMLPNGWARKRFDGVYVIYLKAKAKAKAIPNQTEPYRSVTCFMHPWQWQQKHTLYTSFGQQQRNTFKGNSKWRRSFKGNAKFMFFMVCFLQFLLVPIPFSLKGGLRILKGYQRLAINKRKGNISYH